MAKKKITSVDVAGKAGVSQATVSMILNKKYNVSFSRETVEKVEKAAKEMGYHVPAGRVQRGRTTGKLIVVFCPTLTNPYYVAILQGIEEMAKEKDYNVLVCNTQRDLSIEEQHLKLMESVRPAGIIYTCNPSAVYMGRVEELSRRIPLVIINNRETILEIDAVALNNTKPGRIMARHLLDLGHRKVAFVSPPLTDRQQQRSKRVEGFLAEFLAAGLKEGVTVRSANPYSDTLIPNMDSEYKMGYEMTKEVMQERRDITAFACMNDMIAFGVMDALLEAKYKIPGDVSVIGCDNTLFSSFQGISLTTIEHFVPLKGRDACEIVLKKIGEQKMAKPGEHPRSIYHIEYEPRLIKRKSTSYAAEKRRIK